MDAFVAAGQLVFIAALAYGLLRCFSLSLRYRTGDLKPSSCTGGCTARKRRSCVLCSQRTGS